MRILSIDIGELTLSMWLEEFDFEQAKKNLSSLKKNQRSEQIEKDILNGSTIDISIFNLRSNGEYLFDAVFKYLKTREHVIQLADEITIEDQFFNPRGGTNLRCVKLMENIRSYFVLLHPEKITSITPSRMKTQFFRHMLTDEEVKIKKKRKEKSVERTKEILEQRQDFEAISYIDKLEKEDDVCDAFLLGLARKKKLLQLEFKPIKKEKEIEPLIEKTCKRKWKKKSKKEING